MTSKWTFICSLAISGSGSEWVKTKTNSVHGNTAQKILDLANGRRYDQWDEAERLLVKLLKKVNNYLFGGGQEGGGGCGWDTRPNLLCIIIVCYMYCAALHLLYTLVIVSQLQWYVMSFKPLILQCKLCGYSALCIRSMTAKKFFLWSKMH